MSTRGRSSTRSRFGSNRNQSRPSTQTKPPTRRNFFDRKTIEQEEEKVEEKKVQIENKKVEGKKKQRENNLDSSKNKEKENLINQGQKWFSQFFGGIKRKERANVKIEFNPNVETELWASYDIRLGSTGTIKNYHDTNNVDNASDIFRSYINLLIAIKMLNANTESNKAIMKDFQPLTSLELRVPASLTVAIDCIGKTDIGEGNVARIIGHNSLIKQHLFKSCVILGGLDTKYFNNMMWKDTFTNNIDLYNFAKKYFVQNTDYKFFTEDAAGLDLIHEHGRNGINFLNTYDFEFTIGGEKCKARLPYLDPSFDGNLNKILEWELVVRNFLSAIKVDIKLYFKIIGLALLGWLPLRFIKQKDKKLEELDKTFLNTIFQGVTTKDILDRDNWISITDYCEDRDLFENSNFVANYIKQAMEPIYDDMFNLVKFSPTAHGTPAMIIENHTLTKFFPNARYFSDQVNIVENRHATTSKIKIDNEDAFLGSLFKFNNGIKIDDGFDISLIGSSREMRLALVGKDFK